MSSGSPTSGGEGGRAAPRKASTGRPARVVIEGVAPEVDGGAFPIKRTIGASVVVEADVYADGHDELACALYHRREADSKWSEVFMAPLGNDRWRASFAVTELGRYRYTLRAWVDHFSTWRRDLGKKAEAGQDVSVDLLTGAAIVEQAAKRAAGAHADALREAADFLRKGKKQAARVEIALGRELGALMARYGERSDGAAYPRELAVVVDSERARYGAWYEMFPRSCSATPGAHGTFRDCEARLPYVAEMGFDVLYLPPIHPVGTAYRKGKNNATTCTPEDPGSPWAIGAAEGGHTAILPALGTAEDFRRLVAAAKAMGIDVALDLAFQCSPDHPYVKEHPEWFRWRPDGTIQYAENPPKKYQDIYPLNFDTPEWEALWQELRRVVRHWIDEGVRIFRVDNPHTKPFRFWEWLIGSIKCEHPDVIFLSEAFTRPKVMYHLAKLGFTQSYNYFPWRNTKSELTEYFTELTTTEVKEYFRPNLWPNTPDILTEYLQWGGRPAFMARFVLAATLGASYGIYGPAFELCDNRPAAPGKEGYLDAEKYEIKKWNIGRADSLKDLIARVNGVRKENPALHSNDGLRFHPVDNEQLLCYSKRSTDPENVILVVVNLDSRYTQSGWVDLPLEQLGLEPAQPFQVHDVLTGARFRWQGPRNFVELDPRIIPAHVFRVAAMSGTSKL